MAGKTAAPEETETTPEPPPPRDNRFFTWMRSLDVPRQPGWIGGVCAGIAARLGIDPLIVRGIVVVVAVLGGPALILYAAAWLLLPDQNDKIHLEELFKGRLESPIAGIGALVLLSLLPLTQGFWYAGAAYWGQPFWGDSIVRALWTIVVLGLVVWFVVWIARRASRASTAPTISPATTDARPETIPEPLPGDAAASVAAAPPAPPPAGAPAEELAAWREQQAAWKAEREEFRRREVADAREVNRRRAAEARERGAVAAQERAERHQAWRRANPRVGGSYTAIVVGLAILGGGIAALVASGSGVLAAVGAPVAFAVAALVLGVGIVVAGAIRRRSGILNFFALLLVLATVGAALLPTDREFVPFSDYSVTTGAYTQPAGLLYVAVREGKPEGVTDIWQGAGTVGVSVDEGMSATIEVITRAGDVMLWTQQSLGKDANGNESFGMNGVPADSASLPSGERRWTVVVGDEQAAAEHVIRVWQGVGRVEIWDNNVPQEQGAGQ